MIGREAQPYYGGHLILALHYYSFEYVLTGLVNRLHVNPSLPLSLGFLYLAAGVWKVLGAGRTSPPSFG